MYDGWDPARVHPLRIMMTFLEIHLPSNRMSENYFRRSVGLPPR